MPQAPWRTQTAPSSASSSLSPWRRPTGTVDEDPAILPPEEEESFFNIPNALRVGGGIVGGVLGGMVGGAGGSVVPVAGTAAGGAAGAAIGGGLGAGAGEWLAELLEVRRGQRQEVNPWQVGAQTAIGAVPMGKIGSIAVGAGKGALLGAGATVGTELAETGELPELGDVGRGALGGGVLGGVASGILNRFTRPKPRSAAGSGRTPTNIPPPDYFTGTPEEWQAAVAARQRDEFAGPRPIPTPPPAGSPYRGVTRPSFESFPVPEPVFPDPAEMAMAYQPNLPGAIKAGGRRTGGFDQMPAAELPPLPEGFDELNRILAGADEIDTAAPWRRPEVNPSLTKPLLPSGLDPSAPSIDQTAPPAALPPLPEGFAELNRELGDLNSLEHLDRPAGPFPPRTRPLVPSGLDAAPPTLEQTAGPALPWLEPQVPDPNALVRPDGPFPSLTRPLNPSGLDANPPALDAPAPPNAPPAAPPQPPVATAAGEDPLQKLLGLVEDAKLKDPEHAIADMVADANKDPLTGIPTRRVFDRAGQQPNRLVGRLDMDNFKAINDTHGHAAGDRALEITAEVLKKFARRKGDVVARLGGDEFGLNLEAPLDPASTAQLQQSIEDAISKALADAGLGEVGGRKTGASVGFGADEAAADLAAIARKQARGVSQPRQNPTAAVSTAPEAPSGVRPQGGKPGSPVFGEVDPAAIQVDPKTYQFKGGADAQGVTDRLKAVESWDPIAGGASPVILHRRADGSMFVVDGHQRVGLAKRLQAAGRPVGNLRSIILDESEGVTPAQARRIGAMLNLQQGTGTPTDVAKVLRTAPLTSAERARIPKDQTSGAKLRMGEDLAKLGDDAFLRVVNGQVHGNPARNEAYGAIVGRLIPDHAQQTSALQQLAAAAPDNAYEAEQFVKAIQSAGFEMGTQTNLFGTQEVANSLAAPIAKIMAAARRVLQSEKSALGNAVRNEERLARKGNVLNTAANKEGAEQAGALDRLLDTYGHTVGPVREELKRVAAQLQRGEITAAKAADAVLEVLDRERQNPGAGGSAVRPGVSGHDGPGGPAQPETPTASVAESEGILQQLARTLNVDNKPLVDQPPPLTLVNQSADAAAAATKKELEAAGQQGMFGDSGGVAPQTDVPAGRPTSGASEGAPQAPPQPSALDAILTRHDVRSPAKVSEIGASMKRVGWKGRPLLVVKDGPKETAWTGTHRLAAAKEAGLTEIPRVDVDADALRAVGFDVDELTKQGKKARIDALRKAGQDEAADLLELERGAKVAREAKGPTLRDRGLSPRQKGTNPRAIAEAEELLDAGKVDEAEELLSKQIEAKIQAALKHGTGGSTIYSGGFDPEGFRNLVRKHPDTAWRATSGAIGAATGWYLDDDHPGRGALIGLMAGAGATKLPSLIRRLQTAEVKIGGGGISPVRVARDKSKDIGLFELVGGTPERTIPEQFEMARPAFEKFLKALHEEHARTKAVIPQKRVQALRDRYVTPVISQIRKEAKLAADAKHVYKSKYITAFANRLAGHRTVGQRVISALSKGKIPPDFVERRVAGSVYYVGTGFGLDTALQNLTQPLLAMGHVPSTFIAKAYKDLATNPAAKRMVEGALLPLEKPADAIELTLGPFGRKVGKINAALDKIDPKRRRDPQMWLRMTDQKNREVVYYAARTYAESQGKSVAEADTWARQVMRKTQTEPGALGSNPFHAGPVTGSLRPFTKYPTVFTEHVIDLLKQAGEGQNLGGVARLGATVGGLALLGRATGIDLEDLLISGGRPLGLDIAHPQRSIERIATGAATPTSRAVFDVLDHLRGEADHGLVEDAAGMAIPRYPRKLAQAIGHFQTEGADAPHVTRGPGGKIRDVTTPDETLLNLLGLRTHRQTERKHALADFYEEATTAKTEYESTRRKAYEDLGAAIDTGDRASMQDAIRRIGNVSAVKQFLKQRQLLPEDRFYKTLPPKVRQQLRESLAEAKDLAPPGTRR
jgi:diguanylate cyclase (GGDEF)-like protein